MAAVAADTRYALNPDVAGRVGVSVGTGLSAGDAAQRLAKDGPNELPAEKPPSQIVPLLGQYRTYMQLILPSASCSPGSSRSGPPAGPRAAPGRRKSPVAEAGAAVTA